MHYKIMRFWKRFAFLSDPVQFNNIIMSPILYIMKEMYAIQPYMVGSRNAKSLALIIPAEVTKQYEINTSTVFILRIDRKAKCIILQTQAFEQTTESPQNTMMTAAGQSFEVFSQHASSSAQ
jgi:antitoxin component of MazEF toxin-antitoxin module